jgi:hypothetical protein
MDDNGDPLNLILPNVLYVLGLTRWLFFICQFTSKYNTKAHIGQHFITLIYYGNNHITATIHRGTTLAYVYQ